MYKLKQKSEDFIVKEIPDFETKEKGRYPIFLLKKVNYTTENTIGRVADHLHIKPKFIGYAGIKDKKAVTEQYISINVLKRSFRSFKLKDIEIDFMGYNEEPIYLGRLIGNEFVITIRNLKEKDIVKLKEKTKVKPMVPNLFGEQRLSKNNSIVGKCIIKRDFEQAAGFILQGKGKTETQVHDYLQKHPTDFVGAIRKIPLKIRKLYLHSYQSELFNRAVKEYIKTSKKNIKFPILGFGTESKNKEVKELCEEIMENEGITLRDFIIRSIPELSSAGYERDVFIELKDFKIMKIEEDELNKKAKKAIVSFSLPKGCYATVVIDYLLRKSIC